jgi:hypothetical protein
MSNSFEVYDGDAVVNYEINEDVARETVKRIIDWCKKYNVSCGEGLMQSDDPQIFASILIAKIIDEVLLFKIKFKED